MPLLSASLKGMIEAAILGGILYVRKISLISPLESPAISRNREEAMRLKEMLEDKIKG